MRSLRLVAIASLTLACSDSTGIGLDGPSFLRAFVNGKLVMLGNEDAYMLSYYGPEIQLQALPSTLAPAGNPDVIIVIRNYHGPDTYPIGDWLFTGGWASYSILSGDPPGVSKSFDTDTKYTGSVHISAADTLSGSIAGTFEFSAVATSGTGTVKVSAGSFRVHPVSGTVAQP